MRVLPISYRPSLLAGDKAIISLRQASPLSAPLLRAARAALAFAATPGSCPAAAAFARAKSSPAAPRASTAKRWTNSWTGMRAGKPARETWMASMTPAQRSCSSTMGLSTHSGDFCLFGLMHLTYCEVVFEMVSMSCASDVLNFVATVSEPPLAPFFSESPPPSPFGASAKAPATRPSAELRMSRSTSSEMTSRLRSSQPSVV
mmetsp:Transcript_161599/g.392392  ORF Transcript_161599/g.392392 Transcript_161599/m.392392 type:complete len:203 (+) Transcript_161599:132-740(+)